VTLRLAREAAGAGALVSLAVLVLTGPGLMAGYVPSEAEAFDSVLYARQVGGAGAVLRSLHHHAASGAIACGALFLLATAAAGRPRRASWWPASALLLTLIGVSFSGFLLPMDQFAWWGNRVRLGIVESMPLVGSWLADVLRGGGAFGATTLPRYHALHTAVLPWLAALLLWRLLSAERDGLRAALRERRPLLLAGLALAALWAAALAAPAPLEPRADPTDLEYTPRPEWYFLWLFQVGRLTEGHAWVQSALIPGLGLLALAALPLLPPLSARWRLGAAAALLLGWTSLTGLSLWEDRALPLRPSYEDALAARAAAIYLEDCASCHGETGRGDGGQSRAFGLDARDFTRPSFWEATDRERLTAAIRDGLGEDMPAFGRKLSGEEIAALVSRVERFRPEAEK
jgi:ubiquinol-cytochrome c reductase cytochrome b subunit